MSNDTEWVVFSKDFPEAVLHEPYAVNYCWITNSDITPLLCIK